MTIRSRTLILVLVCTVAVHPLISAQTAPAEAVDDPLSTVIYLLSTTDKDDEVEEKACLAKSLASVDRFDEAHRAVDMVKHDSYVEENFVVIVNELIRRGREKDASNLVTLLLKRFENNAYNLKPLVRPLIFLKRDDELRELIEKLSDSDKTELWFKSADVYKDLGQLDKALAVLKKTVSHATASEYANDRAELAYHYAKLGRETEAIELVQSVLPGLDPKTRDVNVIHDLAAAYRALGKYSEANDLNRRLDNGLNIDETKDLISSASRFSKKGEREKAVETLVRAVAQLNPKEYGDRFNLGDIIDLYLEIGDIQKAEQVAKSLPGSDNMQQEKLLEVVDSYKKSGNKAKAREILRFALDQTNKIDTTEAESGSLWTSGKWDQARYQSQIAIRYMDLRDDKEALRITAQLRKPYLRALVLTEYVAVNKKRVPAKKLASYLEEALTLLRRKQTDVFDSKKFDVYAITARNFAEIGMPKRANEVFAETLTELDRYVIDDDTALLYAMCNIGVDFTRSRIKADENVKTALRKIIKNWEEGEY